MIKLSIFSFLGWDESEVLSRVKSELGWESPVSAEGSWRFDCRVAHLKDYIYMKMIGMTEKDDFYSKLVRAGRLPRDEALQRLESENRLHPEEVKKLLDEVGVDSASFFARLATVSPRENLPAALGCPESPGGTKVVGCLPDCR